MPDFLTLKARLKQLSDTVNESLRGESEFFIQQLDETKEYQGFLYTPNFAEVSKALKSVNLKQKKDYHSSSFFLNLDAGKDRRLKIYNKTVHPLFASDSVSKKIGMGAKQFFQSSYYFHSRGK
jgi:hypothetical protein